MGYLHFLCKGYFISGKCDLWCDLYSVILLKTHGQLFGQTPLWLGYHQRGHSSTVGTIIC